MTLEHLYNTAGNNFNYEKISKIENKLFEVEKILLPSPIDKEGRIYENAGAFGIYRQDTRKVLGVTKGVFTPTQPKNIFKTFLESILELNIDSNNLNYYELKGGSKILFNLEIAKTTNKNEAGKIDDIVYNLGFITGFDGSTKSQVFLESSRLICSNGMRIKNKEFTLSKKNTINNNISIRDFINNISKVLKEVKDYVRFIEKLNKINIGKTDVENFIISCLDIKDTKNVSSQMQRKARKLNEAISIEIDRTGYNAFALLNGATYYTNHMCKTKSLNDFLYLGTGKTINDKAQTFVEELVY